MHIAHDLHIWCLTTITCEYPSAKWLDKYYATKEIDIVLMNVHITGQGRPGDEGVFQRNHQGTRLGVTAGTMQLQQA